MPEVETLAQRLAARVLYRFGQRREVRGAPNAAEIQRRGDQAKAVLENPAFIEAVTGLRDSYVAEWQKQPTESTAATREWLYMLDQTVEVVVRHLTKAMQSGIDSAKLELHKDMATERERGGRRSRTR